VDLPTYDDRYVEVSGKRIRYWMEGEGPAVVLVHGLAASVEFWQYNLAPLARHHRVYALDLLGFGRSDKEIGTFSLPYAAAWMLDFLCAQTAVQHPERVERLILVDPAGFGRELNPLLRLWSIPVAGGAVFWLCQRLFPRLREWVYPGSDSITKRWLVRAAEVLRTPGLRENAIKVARIGVNLRGQREELFRDLHEQLRAMTVPTMIIWGDRDPIVPVRHAYVAQSLIPNSEVQIIRDSGHLPQLERPEEFNRLVLDFLASA
jgi:pimeloyl-ACP methyl ester carboxylesterase